MIAAYSVPPPLFFAPAAFRCAWTTIPSTDSRSGPKSPDRALKTRSNTPEGTRHRNRLETLFHLADRLGRSRHGGPVRNRHGTASGKRRLSAAVPPGSGFLPAGTSLARAHILSVGPVLPAFMMSPACSAHAAVPAVAGTGNGTEPGDSQPECQRALEKAIHMVEPTTVLHRSGIFTDQPLDMACARKPGRIGHGFGTVAELRFDQPGQPLQEEAAIDEYGDTSYPHRRGPFKVKPQVFGTL